MDMSKKHKKNQQSQPQTQNEQSSFKDYKDDLVDHSDKYRNDSAAEA